MKVLGIDPGSVITGYGLVAGRGSRLICLDRGALRMNSRQSISSRLLFLKNGLVEIIESHRPDVMAVEKVFHSVNFKSTLYLGYVRGIILMVGEELGLPLAEYSATQVKVAITGYGRAEKSQVQHMVKTVLGLPEIPKPADVADALAIAICHIHHAPMMQRIKDV